MVCRAKCCSVLPCLTGNDLSCYVPVLTSIPLFLPPVPHPPCPYLPFSFAFFLLGPNCFLLLCFSFFPALPSSPYVFWFVLGSRRPRPVPYTSGFQTRFRQPSRKTVIRRCLRDNGPSAFLPESPVSAVHFLHGFFKGDSS